MPCPSNCRSCSGVSPASCIDCGIGFYAALNKTCYACPKNCLTCTLTSTDVACTSCVDGYSVATGGSCVQTCTFPCATCSPDTPTHCVTCLLGYLPTGTFSCQNNTSCNSTNPCETCPLGFILSNGACVNCAASFCDRCSYQNSSICTVCSKGYYLGSNSICTQCPGNCLTCSSAFNCLSCSSGFVLSNSLVTANTSCVACQSPCATCVQTPTTCLTCIGGTTLVGWACVTNVNYGFSVTLNTPIATFNQNYTKFLLALAAQVDSSNVNTVTINSIVNGSVIVNGNVSTNVPNSNSAQLSIYLDNMKNLLLASNFIAGMPIAAS